jgi:sugar-specific transcriptional regulator TrmB
MFDYSLIGLSKRDIRIYEALFRKQNASLRALADDTGINRGTVHESVKHLTKLGLASFYEAGKQKRYVAQDPTVIQSLLAEKKNHLNDAELEAKGYISHLQEITKDTPRLSFATFYEGNDGIAAILRDVLSTVRAEENKSYEVISSKFVRDYLYNNFLNFTRQRIKHNLYVRVIAIGEGGQSDKQSNRKWLKPDKTGTPPNCYTIIYGDKTAFISLDEQRVPMGIVIHNPGMTALQRVAFEQMWASL